MAIENEMRTWTFEAEEDQDALASGIAGHLHKAITSVAGIFATDGRSAVGLLKVGGKSGEFNTFGYDGIMKFVAFANIASADTFLTVTDSGFLTNAGSGDYVVGRSLSNVASGAAGPGMFDFAHPVPYESMSGYLADFQTQVWSSQATTVANRAIDFSTGDHAATSPVADGIALNATVTGGNGRAVVMGKVGAWAREAVTESVSLKVDTAGYLITGNSGDLLVGRALTAATSGQAFLANVNFATPHYATSCLDVMYA